MDINELKQFADTPRTKLKDDLPVILAVLAAVLFICYLVF